MVLHIFRTYGFAIRFFDSWRLINAKAVLFQRLSQDKEKRDRVRKSVESRVANILEGLPVPRNMLAVGYIPESNRWFGHLE